jgi:Fe2+ transport system protein FeoA
VRQKPYFAIAVTTIVQPAATVRLDELPPRVCAVVCHVATDDEDTQRLKALGVCLGRRVELVRVGDPLILKVFGSRLGISAELARRVRVEICQPGHCALKEEHEGA